MTDTLEADLPQIRSVSRQFDLHAEELCEIDTSPMRTRTHDKGDEHSTMKTPSVRKLINLIVTATLAIALGACAGSDPLPASPPPEPVSFAALDADAKLMSHRWIAPDSFSLDSRELRAVRSYIESESTYEHTADPAAVHPGYWDVQTPPEGVATPQYGTIYHHILLVEPAIHMGEPVTEIFVCSDYMHTAISTRHGWIRVATKRYTPLRVRLSTDTPTAIPILDYGHRLPYPTWNVFEGLEIERFIDGRIGESGPRTDCDENMPGYTPETPQEENLPAAPVVEPFYPGWPTVVEDSK
ncbi:hypothetical protein [Rhodococcus sp. SJ-3]|uniref:hypothetical protein n=1 Tax=Rhodococcus sp. SJ-3 TaxID=3454628 RepID=UPI003F799FBE